MPRLWLYQSRGDPPFRALTQPAAPGWPRPAVAPDRLPKAPQQPGWWQQPVGQQPAAPAASRLGWAPVSPEVMPRRRPQPGDHTRKLDPPGAATAQNRLGWEPVGGRRVPGRTAAQGWWSPANDKPPGPTTPVPFGFEPVAPAVMPGRAAPGGEVVTLSPAVESPGGWTVESPAGIVRVRAAGGDAAGVVFPAAGVPGGWTTEAPATSFRGFRPVGYADLPAAAPETPVGGWEAVAEWSFRRPARRDGWLDRGLYEVPASPPPPPDTGDPLTGELGYTDLTGELEFGDLTGELGYADLTGELRQGENMPATGQYIQALYQGEVRPLRFTGSATEDPTAFACSVWFLPTGLSAVQLAGVVSDVSGSGTSWTFTVTAQVSKAVSLALPAGSVKFQVERDDVGADRVLADGVIQVKTPLHPL